MEVDDEDRAFQALTLSFGWLTKRELCEVSTLNSDFLVAARQDYLWQPTLSELEEMWLHDTVWKGHEKSYFPPRIRGELRDKHSYFPHAQDKIARQHPEELVLTAHREMNMEDGKLYDCFYRAQEPLYKKEADGTPIYYTDWDGQKQKERKIRDEIWLPREFPVQCNVCPGVAMSNEEEMIRHCCSYAHVSLSKPEEYRIPPEYEDPRHNPGYAQLSVFHKARVLSEYRNKITSAVRAVPMDENAMAEMREYVIDVKNAVWGDYQYFVERGWDWEGIRESDYEAAIAKCTVERVVETAVEKLLVDEFLRYGMNGEVLLILRHGWTALELADSRLLHFASMVSGWEIEK